VGSGDGWNSRSDEVIAEVKRKTKCVDDTATWDKNLEEHWWRMIDFLRLMGNNGIVLNKEKFQFAQREVEFAGFHISESEVRPQEKCLNAIRDFPTPTCITDVRSWFGLVHQVSHYNKLKDMMAPFKPLLSQKMKFTWNGELETAFQQSKKEIVHAIERVWRYSTP